jgi:uncharacterized heparinase superfamily protein
MTGPGLHWLLNESGDLAEDGWDGEDHSQLWRYNQHYFDDLNAENAGCREQWHRQIMNDWIDQNPAGCGTGWEPYPTSLRIVNWIGWELSGASLEAAAIQSLAVQARWLACRLEWHLLGNHLVANAKALVFAGLFFEGSEADQWRAVGLGILAREVPEQILGDGGQFELSPMYHALAVEDFLDLINIAAVFEDALDHEESLVIEGLRRVLPGMLRWLEAMEHPDGAISFFNDSAMGIAPSGSELRDFATRLSIEPIEPLDEVTWLSESGYARLEHGETVLIADLAAIGPDYLPGHAHADTLSFELSLHGQRVFVNSGTSLYGTGDERLRQRGTKAHNTVLVGNGNSSEVWSGFRVARRARTHGARCWKDEEDLCCEASHDGYGRLSGSPVHHRRWALSGTGLVIEDEVSQGTAHAEARYHLHPDVVTTTHHDGEGSFTLPGGVMLHWHAPDGATRLESSSWHPEFGLSLPSQCLVVPLVNGFSRLELTWSKS